MVATVYVHVGTSKAGSTSIQNFMHQNRHTLMTYGLSYGPGLRGTNHVEAAAAFCTRSSRVAREVGVHGETDRQRLQRWLDSALARAAGERNCILSSEHLSTLLKRPDDIAAFGRFMRRHFDRVVVIVVLRRVGHWLPSAYVESVRGGSVKLLDAEYVHQRRRLLDQRRLVRLWAEACRPDDIGALPFLESDKSHVWALVDRMLIACGVERPREVAWTTPPALRNPSMGGYATEVLRLANPMLTTSRWRRKSRRRRVIDYVAQTWPGSGLTLTPAAEDALTTRGWDDGTIAGDEVAWGLDWERWVTQPQPEVRPQLTLTEKQRDEAMRLLAQEKMVRGVPGLVEP
jgi:hypothetical protein